MTPMVTLLLGGRGSGKTYNLTKWALDKAKTKRATVAVVSSHPGDLAQWVCRSPLTVDAHAGPGARVNVGGFMTFDDACVPPILFTTPNRLLGTAMDCIAIDEPTPEAYEAALSVCRKDGAEIMLATTPGFSNRAWLGELAMQPNVTVIHLPPAAHLSEKRSTP